MSSRGRTRPTLAAAAVWLALGAQACVPERPYYAPRAPQPAVHPLPEGIRQRVVLLGDAGDPAPAGEPVLRALSDTASSVPDRTLVVFLGDNIYQAGLPPEGPGRADAERRLRAQIEAVLEAGAHALFIPGNHDWAQADGRMAVLRQERLATEADPARVSWLPRGGCPGPEVYRDLAGVSVVALDTEWWLRELEQPGTECGPTATGDLSERLRSVLAGLDGEVIMVAHHPLATLGRHSSRATWQDHLFPLRGTTSRALVPLPVLGSLFHWLLKPLTYTPQSMKHERNRSMRAAIEAGLAGRRPLVYAAGHDHSLQVLEGDAADYVLVSGAGSASKSTAVGHDGRTLFSDAASGFMVLDFLLDGSVLLRVVEPAKGVVFSRWLRDPGNRPRDP